MARAMQVMGFAAVASADMGPSARQLRGYAANNTLQTARGFNGQPRFSCSFYTDNHQVDRSCESMGCNGKEVFGEFKCYGGAVDHKYVTDTFGGAVEVQGFPSPSAAAWDKDVFNNIFDIPYCGGMETVGYARSTATLTLYTGISGKWDNSSDDHIQRDHYENKGGGWWFAEETMIAHPLTPVTYANTAAAIPYVPQTFVVCEFAPMDGFFIGSGAPRDPLLVDPNVCHEYNVASSRRRTIVKGLTEHQDPLDSLLQIYAVKPKNAHQHPIPGTCRRCDTSNADMSIYEQTRPHLCRPLFDGPVPGPTSAPTPAPVPVCFGFPYVDNNCGNGAYGCYPDQGCERRSMHGCAAGGSPEVCRYCAKPGGLNTAGYEECPTEPVSLGAAPAVEDGVESR
jgi:hypothetical protein